MAADAGGTMELRVNGTSLGIFTGDTKNHASLNDWDQWGWGMDTGGPVHYYDCVFVVDNTSGGSLGGEGFVYARVPNATAGGSTFTGATTGFATVDERPVNYTDYAEGLLTGELERYTAPVAGFSPGTFLGVKTQVEASRDGVLTQVEATVKSGATTVYGTATTLPGAGSWGVASKLDLVDPNTATTWTQAGVEASEFGARVS